MKKFIYTSPIACHTTIKVNGKAVEFSLYENECYELPANDAFVLKLIAQKRLTELKNKTTKKK